MVTAERLREIVIYNPDTGEFVWRVNRTKAKAGKRAGSVKPDGYRWIGIDRRLYADGRLAWLYMTGEWPKHSVDHKNCNPLDARWENLREATVTQQNANVRVRGRVGLKGVYESGTRFYASIRVAGRSRYLGRFDTAQEASAAYMAEATRVHGEFARVA